MIIFFINSAFISILNFAPVFIIFKIYNHALVTGSIYYLFIIFLFFIFLQLFLYQLEIHRKIFLKNYVNSFKKDILNKIIKLKINTQNDRDKKLFDELSLMLNKDFEKKVIQVIDLLFAIIYVLLTIFIDYRFTVIMVLLSFTIFFLNLKINQFTQSITITNINVNKYFSDYLLNSQIKFNLVNLKKEYRKNMTFDINLTKIEKLKVIKNIFIVSIYIFSSLLVMLNNLNPVLIFVSAIILFRINSMLEHIQSFSDLFIFKIFIMIKKLKFNKIRIDNKSILKLHSSSIPLVIENFSLNDKHENQLIKNFSYCFHPEGIYTISGISGSGKTTLLKTISGIDNFFSKNIHFNNVPSYLYNQLFLDVFVFIPEYINYELRHFIDYVFGEKKYDKDCSLMNIFSKYINLSNLFKNKFTNSQSVYKLLYIILCLSKKPKVLLLDEPSIKFNSTEFAIFNDFLKHAKANKTITIIASNDSRVLKLAAQKFFFDDSKSLSLVK